ncbi:NAD(P)/FAD-dependent oxidoreductase [Salipiger sp. PrR002]|uniref:flavin-containing monooxygenase n=1 Tax=Salipiger sp. PrR002 TaxID=2706489 RepID=UPI0013B6948F|nr:NAD(P)/FAD-dependent oxidoreductase [Salipiger sp. PrR002]NDV98848.1 NAD(P)-binding domain-containing protein [Salipiger sp. PrR002]NDW55585.1 NAD(P)-binding domain-containing protein [Salipiger sp. PrR004]
MPKDTIDTLVIGAGQAGVAMSEHLGRAGIPHLVLEKDRIAERWRSGRWDSLVANGPAWHDRFPGMEFDGDGEAFIGKDGVADYFERYAEKLGAPIRCGVEVTRLQRLDGQAAFRVETSDGVIEARNVVSATGPFQRPVIPPVVPQDAPVTQLHSAAYRNPQALPEGAVLVVGSGSSGAQIADELNRAGRKVYLSVGPHGRPPRAYRGRDYCWWLGVLGLWDIPAPAPGTEHVTIAVSGARGGRTVEFRQLAAEGITLLGRTESYAAGRISFAGDLRANVEGGDADYLAMLDMADAFVARNGLDLPEEPEARALPPDPDCMVTPLQALDLAESGITSIIWATGYALDYGWMELDVFDETGRPRHQRGVSPERGLYFLGLPWLSRRGSSFIWGVWHDARYIADQIAIQHSYDTYDAGVRGLGSGSKAAE